MYDFLTQHQSLAAMVAYWIFSAAVSSMPDPTGRDRPGYLWLYRFCHTTAGNISTAVGGKISGLKILVPLFMIPVLFSTTACAVANYKVHPGALNKTDSAAYDTLMIAESVIDQARVDYQRGLLRPRANAGLDILIRSYNAARESWLTYRGAVSTNATADSYLTQLNKNMADLSEAIRTYKEVK